MKRCLLFLPLLGLAPLCNFLGNYLGGAGILPGGFALLVSAVSMFILPWLVAAIFAAVPKTAWITRIALFICAMLIQACLQFGIVPAGATCEMMGFAHKLRGEFSPDQLRSCAEHLWQKRRDGTLTLGDGAKDRIPLLLDSAMVVADSELPDALRGRFRRVLIQKDPSTGDEQVIFVLNEQMHTGIICDGRPYVREFFVCSMAEGVHTYHYQRE
jgi:hypothetical protein